jgi:hypothetical protein
LTIVGSHPQPGTYLVGDEHAHGIHVDGGSGVTFERLDIRNMQGDGFYFAQCGTTPGSNAVIRDSRVADNGRMGIAVVAWTGLRAERMTYHNMAFRPIDLEPDWNASYQQVAIDMVFSGGVSTGWNGRFTSGLVDASAFYFGTPYDAIPGRFAPVIRNVLIEDQLVRNGMTGLRTIFEGRGYRITDVTIRNNRAETRTTGIGTGGWVHGTGADRVSITDNHQDVPQGAYVVSLSNSTSVTASGNTGDGLAGQVKP